MDLAILAGRLNTRKCTHNVPEIGYFKAKSKSAKCWLGRYLLLLIGSYLHAAPPLPTYLQTHDPQIENTHKLQQYCKLSASLIAAARQGSNQVRPSRRIIVVSVLKALCCWCCSIGVSYLFLPTYYLLFKAHPRNRNC